jgi:hypothetical protein
MVASSEIGLREDRSYLKDQDNYLEREDLETFLEEREDQQNQQKTKPKNKKRNSKKIVKEKS